MFKGATSTGVVSEGGANIWAGHGIADLGVDLLVPFVTSHGVVSQDCMLKRRTLWTLHKEEEK